MAQNISRIAAVVGVFAALVASVFPASVSARKVNADTPFLVLGSSTEPSRIVGVGDILASSRVVYAHLAEADEDIFGADGKVVGGGTHLLLAKGAQMFGVVSADGRTTYCAVEHKAVGLLDGFFVMNRDKHTCFIDKDGDGRFEESYDLRTKLTSLPIYYDAETSGNALPNPAAYHLVDPTTLKFPMFLDLEFTKLKSDGKKIVAFMRLRSEKLIDYFSDEIIGDINGKNATLKAFGVEIEVSPQSAGNISSVVRKGFGRFEFSTKRPIFYYNIIFI